MKGSEQFKKTILSYLTTYSQKDLLFKDRFENPNKSIDECINYIFTTVQKSGLNGFADEEVYNMAIHYYDEENLEINQNLANGSVVVNHHVELSEDEIIEIKQNAVKSLISDEKRKLSEKHQKKQMKKKSVDSISTPSLFD